MPRRFYNEINTTKYKSVRFSELCKVRPIKSCVDMSDATVSSLWRSEFELKSIRQDMKVEVKRALLKEKHRNNDCFPNHMEDTSFCPRGLECFHPKTRKTRCTTRRLAKDAVLGQQDFQTEVDYKDEEYLAYMYAGASRASVRAALLRANHDEKAATDEDDDSSSESTIESEPVETPRVCLFSKRKTFMISHAPRLAF